MRKHKNTGQTPLEMAVRLGLPAAEPILLAGGADPRERLRGMPRPKGASNLHNAAKANDTEAARWLMAVIGAEVNAAEKRREKTPLHFAAEHNAEAMARLLLENGAEVNARSRVKTTPLHFAARRNAEAMARLLLENGAEVNAGDKDEWTPLHYAARHHAEAVAELLLKNGAEVNARTEDEWTSLDFAIAFNYAEMQSFLKSKGGRCNLFCE